MSNIESHNKREIIDVVKVGSRQIIVLYISERKALLSKNVMLILLS